VKGGWDSWTLGKSRRKKGKKSAMKREEGEREGGVRELAPSSGIDAPLWKYCFPISSVAIMCKGGSLIVY